MCHVVQVTCHLSHVTCPMSRVACQTKKLKMGQRVRTSRWRVCYQWGLPRLVLASNRLISLKIRVICRTKIFLNFAMIDQLDGVAPLITDPPPTRSTTLSKKLRHFTRGTWHKTCDTWHVTSDTWWGVNILSKCQLPKSYGFRESVFWRYFNRGWLTSWVYESVED